MLDDSAIVPVLLGPFLSSVINAPLLYNITSTCVLIIDNHAQLPDGFPRRRQSKNRASVTQQEFVLTNICDAEAEQGQLQSTRYMLHNCIYK
jgi:hypothetical protein